MSDPLLVADNIHKTYRMGRTDLQVLRGCSLKVQPGEFVAIMGKSGSGKSTLLHILGALDAPETGEVYYQGQRVCHPETRIARIGHAADRVVRALQWIVVVLLILLYLIGLPLFIAALIFFPPVREHVVPVGMVLIGGLGLLPVQLALLLSRLILTDCTEHRRIRLRRNTFGFVFQFYHLLPELNVLENTVIPRMIRTWPWLWFRDRRSARADARQTLETVGLTERLKHRPSELSGGERQRVAIARALIHKPAILFADEPTGNLDAAAGRSVMDVLCKLHREGQTIVIVTHDPSIAEFADRVLHLERGQLQA